MRISSLCVVVIGALASCHSVVTREHRVRQLQDGTSGAGGESGGAGSQGTAEESGGGSDAGQAGEGGGQSGERGQAWHGVGGVSTDGGFPHVVGGNAGRDGGASDGGASDGGSVRRQGGSSCAHRCGEGHTCTFDGRACIKTVPSCTNAGTPGCGAVTIEGGSFKMGWRAVDPDAFAGEPVVLDAFAIDAYEVTVARFRVFWEAGHPLPSTVTYPNGQAVGPSADPAEPATSDVSDAYNWSTLPANREDFPINKVSWATAFAFCAWDGGRLPTEAEWEFVATGRAAPPLLSGRTYPWGEEAPACDKAQYIDCLSVLRSAAVGAFPHHAGVFQMAGNVSEWTADYYEAYGGRCWDGTEHKNPLCYRDVAGPWTARGGSFTASTQQLTGQWRLAASNISGARGMRCARAIKSR